MSESDASLINWTPKPKEWRSDLPCVLMDCDGKVIMTLSPAITFPTPATPTDVK